MIRFPRVHIATSAVNRIMNVADELAEAMPAPASVARDSVPPIVADTAAQSVKLDQALDQPTGPTPPIEAAPDPGASVDGKPLLATMLDPG